jgi:3-oxoacyl-[acyl-carrier-protein] synthase-1/3-oxoacyl-[acyl-carrier-protein] synthase II
MRGAERTFVELGAGAPITDPASSTYFGPVDAAARTLGIDLEPSVVVLGACASAALAIGLGLRWLERGACDLVLAGGFDEVTVFVAAGFEVLRATTASPPPRPFRLGRDGMSLGEGAAVLALARAAAGNAMAFVTGFGVSSDAIHLMAPDRTGGGLARAARAALSEAGAGPIDLVSAHATATPFNDASESRAIGSALGTGAGAGTDPVVHPFKAQIGHALGAGSALELLVAVDAMRRGVLPAAAGEGPRDPDAAARTLERAEAGTVRRALKLASAFGGVNAALVVSSEPGPSPRPLRPAFLHGGVHLAAEASLGTLAEKTGLSDERIERADSLVRFALGALVALSAQCGSLKGAGLIVGTAMGPIETNAVFAASLRDGGVRAAEPRRFAYTSPNTVAGECSIAFGLDGPSFAVGGGLHAGVEALVAATLLVEAGDAERIAVVAVDEAGLVTHALAGDALTSGAVAFLVSATEGPSRRARVVSATVRRSRVERRVSIGGHAALLPLLAPVVPSEIVAVSPPDIVASVSFEV